MNQTDSFQRNRTFRHVPAGHDVIRDTSPEQPIAAWTANELACLSTDKHVGSSPEPNSWEETGKGCSDRPQRRCTETSP